MRSTCHRCQVILLVIPLHQYRWQDAAGVAKEPEAAAAPQSTATEAKMEQLDKADGNELLTVDHPSLPLAAAEVEREPWGRQPWGRWGGALVAQCTAPCDSVVATPPA